MIEIKDVMKSFENKNVLNHLNVTISSGSIFGLIGPNGAGKSTLLYLLNGISKCDEGSILFDGKEVYENPDVKKDILFISDDPYYFNFATIDEMKSRLLFQVVPAAGGLKVSDRLGRVVGEHGDVASV